MKFEMHVRDLQKIIPNAFPLQTRFPDSHEILPFQSLKGRPLLNDHASQKMDPFGYIDELFTHTNNCSIFGPLVRHNDLDITNA